jgi:5-methylthioadenosine/S-adenosylhomocysteine deaminase
VHCVRVDDEDIALIARRNAKVSHNPESNMKLAAGVAPVPQMLAAGITVGLGTDGCASNNDLDLFQTMDFTAKLHKLVHRDRPYCAEAGSAWRPSTAPAPWAGARDRPCARQAGRLILTIPGAASDADLPPGVAAVYATGADADTPWWGQAPVQNRRLLTVDPNQILPHAEAIASADAPLAEKGESHAT